MTSCPVMWMLPALGSIRRISVRTRVDLPEPDRPMTTNTSPGWTSIDDVADGHDVPVLRCSSQRGSSASGVPMTLSGCGPKIFQTPSARTTGSLAGAAPVGGAAV